MKASLLQRGVFVIADVVTIDAVQKLVGDILSYIATDKREVTLMINSSGGDPAAAILFNEFVRTLRKEISITGIAFGECGSAALALLQCCHKRKALKHCGIFPHNKKMSITLVLDGTEETQFKKHLENHRKIHDTVVALQLTKTGLTREEWDVLTRKGDLSSAVMTASEALQNKLIDDVIDSFEVF